MTGPEHYRDAERLLSLADEKTDPHEAIRNAMLIQTAQVHATLALAAATAEAGGLVSVTSGRNGIDEHSPWERVLA